MSEVQPALTPYKAVYVASEHGLRLFLKYKS